jgi:hypothetical protein
MTNGPDPARKWRKSTYSGTGNNCVEVAARRSGEVAVRDSKIPDGPGLTFTPQAWMTFTRRAKRSKADMA